MHLKRTLVVIGTKLTTKLGQYVVDAIYTMRWLLLHDVFCACIVGREAKDALPQNQGVVTELGCLLKVSSEVVSIVIHRVIPGMHPVI